MSPRVSTQVQIEMQLKIEQELLDFLDHKTETTAAPAKHTWARKATSVRKRRDTLAAQLSKFSLHWMIYEQPLPLDKATCTHDPMHMIAEKSAGKIVYVVESNKCPCCERRNQENTQKLEIV